MRLLQIGIEKKTQKTNMPFLLLRFYLKKKNTLQFELLELFRLGVKSLNTSRRKQQRSSHHTHVGMSAYIFACTYM